MLDTIANIAEIIAGIAIVIAAARAWPVFSNMEAQLGRARKDKRLVTKDMSRLNKALNEVFNHSSDALQPDDLLIELLAQVASNRGIDLHFEYFSERDLPGRLSATLYREGKAGLISQTLLTTATTPCWKK